MSVRALTRTVGNQASDTTELRAGLYLRISDDREGRELGVGRQLEDTTEVANRLGARVVRVYKDNDIGASTRSRSRKSRVRKEYLAMLADAKAGRINLIIAYTTGRLTRRPRENEDHIELAERHNVRYEYVRSPSFDLNTANGRMIARYMAAKDANESEEISERVARTRSQQAPAGFWGGGRRPYGFQPVSDPDGHYRNTRLVLDQAEADEVFKAAEAVLMGVSLRELTRQLNNRNVRTVTGVPWTSPALRDVLLRPRNAGIVVYQGDEVGIGLPPIMPEPMFRAVQEILLDPARRTCPEGGPVPRWLGSLIYLCGVCGSSLSVIHGGGKAMYVCRGKGAGASRGHVNRSAPTLDAFVTKTIIKRLARPDAIDLIRLVERTIDVAALRTEALALRERQTELTNMFTDGEIVRKQLAAGTLRIERRLSEINQELADAVEISPLAPILGAPDVAKAWEDLTLANKRAILRSLVSVRVLPAGRGPGFNPKFVDVQWQPQDGEGVDDDLAA